MLLAVLLPLLAVPGPAMAAQVTKLNVPIGDVPELLGVPDHVVINVSVVAEFEGLDDAFQPPPMDTRIAVTLADTPVSIMDSLHDLSPWSRRREPWPAVHRFEVPAGRALSILAYSPSCGITERVLTPAEVAALAANPSQPLTLVLPPARASATLGIDVEAEPTRRPEAEYAIQVRSPLGGVVLAHGPFGHPGGMVPFVLPPGDYVVTVDTYRSMCGNGQPLVRPSTGLREHVRLAPGEKRTLARFLDRGAPFGLRVDVRNCETDVESSRVSALAWMNFVTPADLTIGSHLWSATATIERLDKPTAPVPVWFGWNECAYAFEHHNFPLGHNVYSTHRYTPGRYRLTISSPRIETQTHDFVIDWSESNWPESHRRGALRGPERVEVQVRLAPR